MVDFAKKVREYAAVKAKGSTLDRQKALQERLRTSVKQVQPNVDLNPQPVVKAPPKKEEHVPTLQEVVANPTDRLKISRLITSRYEVGQEEKILKAKSKQLTEQLKPYLSKYEAGKLDYDDYRVNYFESGKPYVDPKLLLAAGVSPKIIADCTVRSSFTVLKVTLKSQPEDEE